MASQNSQDMEIEQPEAQVRSGLEIIGWTEEQALAFQTRLRSEVGDIVRSALTEAFHTGNVAGQNVTNSASSGEPRSSLLRGVEEPVVHPSASRDLSRSLEDNDVRQSPDSRRYVPTEKDSDLSRFLSRVKLGQPEKWEDVSKDSDVRQFLRSVKRYFELNGLPERLWGLYATTFLKGKALDLWELEFEEVEQNEGAHAVTWGRFEQFMLQSYGSLLPVREARDRYDKLQQTGSVADFVRNMRQAVRELQGSVLHPGGSVIIDFIAKLKPEVRSYVQNNAPEGWWTSISPVYKKALQFEMNQRAAVHVKGAVNENPHAKPHVSSELGKRPAEGKVEKKSAKKQKANGKEVFTPKKKWMARKREGRCLRCGQPGHVMAECKNPKSAEPFQKGN